MKITKMLKSGYLNGEIETTEQLLYHGGHLLDEANSHDILGEVVFEAEDGKTYAATVEIDIGEINPDYLAEVLAELEEDRLIAEDTNAE